MKRKNFKSLTCFILLICLLCTLLCSCSSANDKSEGYAPENNTSGLTPEGSELPKEDQSTSQSDRKLIRKIFITAQTKEYDTFIEAINNGISEFGGYIESSRSDGEKLAEQNERRANIVARIPADKTDSFIESITGEHSNIISREESAQDVTLSYVDTQSRLSSLRAQKDALEKLYEKAESISEITYVQKELSGIISEIEAYESTLRELDSLVSYSTVTLNINEVEVYTEPQELSFSEMVSKGLSENFATVASFFTALAVFVITHIPFLLIWIPLLLIAVAVGLIIIRIKRKKDKKLSDEKK